MINNLVVFTNKKNTPLAPLERGMRTIESLIILLSKQI
jgi:hypothetical protein